MPMVKRVLSAFGLMAAILSSSQNAQAAVVTFDWTGAGNYAMTGQFGFSDTLIGSHISGSSLSSFDITGTLSGNTIGSWGYSGPSSLAAGYLLNFNFDSSLLKFAQSGSTGSAGGELWNMNSTGTACNGFGFEASQSASLLCLSSGSPQYIMASNGGTSGFSNILLTPDTPSVSVPEPGTLLLAAIAFLALGLTRKRSPKP